MLRSLCKAMWRFLKTLNYDVIKLFYFFLLRAESRALKRYVNMHTRVHHGIVPCSHKVEATKVSLDRQTDKHHVVRPYCGKSSRLQIRASTCVSIHHTYIHRYSVHSSLHSLHVSISPSIQG